MFQDKYVFAQLVSFMNRSKFNRIVAKYGGNRYVKISGIWLSPLLLITPSVIIQEWAGTFQDHLWPELINTGTTASLKSMLIVWWRNEAETCYGDLQVRNELSIRLPLICALLYSGGQNSAVRKVTLKYTRCMIWKHRYLHFFISPRRQYTIQRQWRKYLMNRVLTTFLTVLTITSRCCTGSNQIEACFVVRAKKNLGYKTIKWKRMLPKNVFSDMTIELTGFYPRQYYPVSLRLVRYWDEEQKREFAFLTNAMHLSSLQVAELYKKRWQIELFFYVKLFIM